MIASKDDQTKKRRGHKTPEIPNSKRGRSKAKKFTEL